MATPVRIALVGAGHMGSNHARVISGRPDAEVAVVVDRDPLRAELLAGASSSAWSTSIEAALGCDAAVVATTAETHWQVAQTLIEGGVPTLIEKPLAPGYDEANSIVKLAAQHDVPITCGFVERFNPVIRTASQILTDSRVLHFVSVRHSPFNAFVETSVVHDLLIHDADLAVRLCGGQWIERVSGALWREPDRGTDEIADCTVVFESGSVATMSASRMCQRKVREIRLATDDVLIELDLVRRDITVYKHKWQHAGDGAGYRAETLIDVPFVQEAGEPLGLQLQHFLDLVRGEKDHRAELETLLTPHATVAHLIDGAPVGRSSPATTAS